MTIRVLSYTKIAKKRTISMTHEIAGLLDVIQGDEILFVLDKKGNIEVRKYKGELILDEGEKYISSSTIIASCQDGNTWFEIYLTSDIRKLLDTNIGDYVLFVLDKKGNIILKNTILYSICSKTIINKDITCMVIGLTTIYQNRLFLPMDLFDILDLYEEDIIFLYRYGQDNIIISKEIISKEIISKEEEIGNLLEEGKITTKYKTPSIYLQKTIRNILNLDDVDKILWIFDEEGNIIIRNVILSDNCINI